MTNLEQQLLAEHGPIMNDESTAKLLDYTPGGLLNAIHGNTPLGKRLAKAKTKIGKRVLFRTSDLARMLSE
mgnify:CR=1 FL=1